MCGDMKAHGGAAGEGPGRDARYEGLSAPDLLARLPDDGAVAEAGRQGNPAQEPEPDLLPDQRRRPRGDPRPPPACCSGPATTGSIPYYRDRALCLALGMTPLEMLLARRRRQGRSRRRAAGRCRRTGATSALNIVSQSSPTGTQCLQAVGCAEAGRIYERVTAIAEREAHFHADEVTYVSIGDGTTSEGEFWESLNSAVHLQAAGRLPGRRQRLRDLGAGRSADAGRRHLEARRVVPRPLRPEHRRHRLPRQLHARWAPRSTYARARKGPALVHARVIRPYSHSLSDDEKLYKTADERAAEATRDPITRLAAFLRRRGHRDRGRARRRIVREVDEEVNAAADGASRRREAGARHRRAVRLLARRRSDVGGVRHRAASRRQARHDGRGHQPHAEGRDGAQPAHRRLRRGRGRLQPRGGARDASRARAACSR